MKFRCANGIRQGGSFQNSIVCVSTHPSLLLYTVYTDDLNHHLQATGVGCYVGGAWVNSLSYADDVVLLTPTVTALHRLLEVCHAYMLDLMKLYTTQRKQYVCWSGQNSHRVSSQQESGLEMRNLALSRNFVT